jgi:hypothetical protein
MKNKAEIIFGLLAIGILVIVFKDRLFKKKVDVNTQSSSINSVPPIQKPINTENLGLNTPSSSTLPIKPSESTTYKDRYGNHRYVPKRMTQEEYQKLADKVASREKNCPKGMLC